MDDLAMLILRLTAGSLLAGHGSQKLFGWFGGHGLQGTSGWLESMGLRPGKPWAILAGGSEFGGGLLTSLGFLGPAGPLSVIGAMLMATIKAHGGKPIWVTSGGAELPVTNMAIASALLLAGPGAFSVDSALGLEVPRWLAIPGLAAVAAAVALGMREETGGSAHERPAARRASAPRSAETPAVERVSEEPSSAPQQAGDHAGQAI